MGHKVDATYHRNKSSWRFRDLNSDKSLLLRNFYAEWALLGDPGSGRSRKS